MTNPRRFFNRSERVALFLAADGRCENCGIPLEPGWHADHVQPWSRGGATDVVNGQALCPACDLLKGVTVSCNPPTPGAKPIPPLRQWQMDALEKLSATDAADFLLVATPAAGKTRVAAEEMRRRLRAKEVERVVVVVPTKRLQYQWKDAVHYLTGISLETDWQSDAPDMDGIVVTYQQVAAGNAPRHRHDCRRSTMVILDEIHHAGERRQWGEALKEAFELAHFRLALSGTPFRSDQNPIPFVTYVNGVAQADEPYGYGAALRDEVCRPVFFPRTGGWAEWAWKGKRYEQTFEDKLSERQEARRLFTALKTGDFLPGVIREADAQLTELRQEHPCAAGLVIAIDQDHAREIAELVEQITGSPPVLAISDIKNANEVIDAFVDGTDRWLVAVDMVSEGVDIPRLRLGVYATTIRTELFFRQAVGRVVRSLDFLDDDSAFFYIPDDSKLRQFAELIKVERDHELRAMVEPTTTDDREEEQPERASSFVPYTSVGQSTGTTFDGLGFSAAELLRAETLARQAGLSRVVPAAVAHLLRLAGGGMPPEGPPAEPPRVAAEPPKRDVKKALRKYRTRVVARIAYAEEIPFAHVNKELNDKVGIASVNQATEDQLRRSLQLAEEWIADLEGPVA